ncbi:MAG: sigma-70 family RNA polymerase sigma factor, partial [Planctomycetota bacterium]
MAETSEIAALLAETDWTRALARSLAGEVHLADDLVQEAWVAALERPPSPDRPLRGWLATILRRRASDLGRERGGRERRERSVARDEALPSAHELVERAALQRTLVEAVLELDEPFRSTVLLRFFEGLAPREIARRSGTSVATVQSRLTRALERLRERLGRGGGRATWLSALAPLLGEPVVAPLLLGIPVMKTVSACVVVSLLVGWLLWPSGESAGARVAAEGAQGEVLVGDGAAGASGGTSLAAKPAREVPTREARGGETPRGVVALEPAAPARLARGRVLDTTGNGRANFELVLGTPKPGRASARCTSGPGGWFEIELARAADSIVAADPAWATVLAGVVHALGETRPLVVVAPRLELAGLVVDEDGVPVSGVELTLELPPGFGNEWGLALDFALAVGWRTRSADDGSFTLAGVPAVAGATLRASLGGFLAQREPAPLTDTRTHVIVLARPARTDGLVHGVVVDPA